MPNRPRSRRPAPFCCVPASVRNRISRGWHVTPRAGRRLLLRRPGCAFRETALSPRRFSDPRLPPASARGESTASYGEAGRSRRRRPLAQRPPNAGPLCRRSAPVLPRCGPAAADRTTAHALRGKNDAPAAPFPSPAPQHRSLAAIVAASERSARPASEQPPTGARSDVSPAASLGVRLRFGQRLGSGLEVRQNVPGPDLTPMRGPVGRCVWHMGGVR